MDETFWQMPNILFPSQVNTENTIIFEIEAKTMLFYSESSSRVSAIFILSEIGVMNVFYLFILIILDDQLGYKMRLHE